MRTSRGGGSHNQDVSTCCSPPHWVSQSTEHTLGPPTVDIFLASSGRSNKLTVSASSWQPETCWKLISFGPVSLQDKKHNIPKSETCSPHYVRGRVGRALPAWNSQLLTGRQQSFARQWSWGNALKTTPPPFGTGQPLKIILWGLVFGKLLCSWWKHTF